MQIVFKHMPLPMHSNAPLAHAAAEAAYRQGRFWEMHDAIFEAQRELSLERFLQHAATIGLDIERFKKDIDSDSVKARIEADVAAAEKLGVTGTPAFFVNGRFLSGAQPFDAFQRVIDEELKERS